MMKKIKTERLYLRNYRDEDKQSLIDLFTDEIVMEHVDHGVMTTEKAEALWRKLMEQFYPQGLDTIYAVLLASEDRYVGHAAIRPRPTKTEDWEISYILKKEEWGKGFATEIARCLVEFGFKELNLPEIFATIDDDNDASIKVAEKAGLKFSHHEFDEDGRFSVYSIPRERFNV